MIAPKNFFLLPRAPTSKQERLLLQSLAGQHKHQDFFIASCCGIVNTTISTFPQFPSDFVIRLCLLGVSGVLRRCRAASAVFPVPSQPAEEFLVVGCQQWETPSVYPQPLYVCPTTLLAPIIREKDIFLASNVILCIIASFAQYELRLVASDNLNENYTTVVIHVNDVNDNPPVFDRPTYETQITEEDDRNLPKRVLKVNCAQVWC